MTVDAVMAVQDRRPSLAVRVLLGGLLLELILLGSGRLVELGPLTLRMWLFGIALGFAAMILLLGGRVHREVVLLILGFLALTATSATVGLLNHAPLGLVADDVKPLLFFLGLLFFHLTIRDQRQVTTIARLIKAGSLILAVSYLALLALVMVRVIPFSAIYALLSQSSEFVFRGEVTVRLQGVSLSGNRPVLLLSGARGRCEGGEPGSPGRDRGDTHPRAVALRGGRAGAGGSAATNEPAADSSLPAGSHRQRRWPHGPGSSTSSARGRHRTPSACTTYG